MRSYPVFENSTSAYHTILPFQKFNLSQLPTTAKNTCKMNWKPIFNIIEKGLNIEQCKSLSALDFINVTCKLETNKCDWKASYIWNMLKNKYNLLQVSIWSKYAQYLMILKYSSEEDK